MHLRGISIEVLVRMATMKGEPHSSTASTQQQEQQEGGDALTLILLARELVLRLLEEGA